MKPQDPVEPIDMTEWKTLALTYPGELPEEIAYGPAHLIDRLEKWLIHYFKLMGPHPAEPEPFAWATFDGEQSYDLRLYAENEDYREDYIKRNGEKYASWVTPLYATPHDSKDQIDALKAELQQRALEAMSLDAQNMELAAERDALKAENARLLAANIDGKNWVDAARNDMAELSAGLAELKMALERIAGFRLSQFMGPHDMSLECINVARSALAKAPEVQL